MDFFPMRKGDAWLLITFVVLAVVFFLPWSRTTTVNGMVVFGWGMGALMFIGPLLGLYNLSQEGKPGPGTNTTASAGGKRS
ncbi:MAG: hypothetical protein HPY55_02775 [Firmicutes bacterium]|nr:hypothetical protein [Bacillota bacterium]